MKSAANALLLLSLAMRLTAAPAERSVRDDLSRVMKIAMFKVVEAVGDDLCHDRIALSLAAGIQVFWLACGRPDEVEDMEHDQVLVLTESMCWVRAALEELHHRRCLQVHGDHLLQNALAHHAFNSATPGGRLH